MPSRTPRGLRNNNPLNLRRGAKWLGEVWNLNGDRDPDFAQFGNLYYGYRAAAKLLLNYRKLYGLNTIEGIIYRFAPPIENNTEAYIERVLSMMPARNWVEVTRSTPLNLAEEPERLADLVSVMHTVENGVPPTLSEEEVIRRAVANLLQSTKS